MNYDFPVIAHIDDVIPHIKDSEEFSVVNKELFTVIDYNFAFGETFGEPDDDKLSLQNKIKRECRGLIFDKSGNLIRRPLHKFFNVEEKNETRVVNVNFDRTHYLLDKLDGSMIAAFLVDGQIYWGTRMGSLEFHQNVQKFVKESDVKYERFVENLIAHGATPIFEWVGPQNRIVLGYEKEDLILTAVRSMKTGIYMPYSTMASLAEMREIPYVKAYEVDFDNLGKVVEYMRILDDKEGSVISFNDGHKLKIKSEWYCQLHKVKSYFEYEKDVALLLLDGGIDDLIPLLTNEQKARLDTFEHWLTYYIDRDVAQICAWTDSIVLNNMQRKDFALHSEGHAPTVRSTIFHEWNNLNVLSHQDIVKCVHSGYKDATTSHKKFREFKERGKMHDLQW